MLGLCCLMPIKWKSSFENEIEGKRHSENQNWKTGRLEEVKSGGGDPKAHGRNGDFYRLTEYYCVLPLAEIGSVIVSGVFCLVKCSLVLGMCVISFFLPFLTLSFAAFCLFPPSPVVKGHAGKMKPNRGEKWNIDFCLHSTVDGVFRFLFFFSRIILSVLLPALPCVVCYHLKQQIPCLQYFTLMRSPKVLVIHQGE